MKSSKPKTAPERAVTNLESAWIRVILEAFAMSESGQMSLNARMIVNELRGNQLPLFDLPNPLYGCMNPLSSRWVHEVIDSLVDNDLLEEDIDTTWGALRLTTEGRRALRRTSLALVDLIPRAPILGRAPEHEQRLFDLRRKIAEEESRPAFSIFDNATLARLAQRKPKTLPELSDIAGFGPQRLANYGRKITALFRRNAETE